MADHYSIDKVSIHNSTLKTRCDMVPDTPDIPEVEHQAHAAELVRPPLSIAPPHTTAWAANDDTPDESIQREAPKGRGGRAKETEDKGRRERGDLRAEVLELLVDALQGHCDEGMWYLKGWWKIDLGSRLAELASVFAFPDWSGHDAETVQLTGKERIKRS